ncbi:MAG TPA: DinB family protein [Bryobacteraceae bacterium]|nr:DinB family protein [Bryobacteraceae bacterium]
MPKLSMVQDLSRLLRDTISRELPHLQALTEPGSAIHPDGPSSWSPKQELGHLIDSAANNHIRFVNATLQPEFKGAGYAQDGWVDLHGYQNKPWSTILDFWYAYNVFLADLVARIPQGELGTMCYIGSSEPATLRFVIEDYVVHMQHHIDHLLQRATVTQYPSATTRAVPNKPA